MSDKKTQDAKMRDVKTQDATMQGTEMQDIAMPDAKRRIEGESLCRYVIRRLKQAAFWRIKLSNQILKEILRTPYLDFKIYRFLKSNYMGTSPISALP
ncbi:hypothetical protein, partial [Helicobacter sp. CLO-3]